MLNPNALEFQYKPKAKKAKPLIFRSMAPRIAASQMDRPSEPEFNLDDDRLQSLLVMAMGDDTEPTGCHPIFGAIANAQYDIAVFYLEQSTLSPSIE
ncbi:MAG: hypothetical protein V4490_00300, partial [Pseudomonadota bacterium]